MYTPCWRAGLWTGEAYAVLTPTEAVVKHSPRVITLHVIRNGEKDCITDLQEFCSFEISLFNIRPNVTHNSTTEYTNLLYKRLRLRYKA
ncbi:Uncharacterised protein [Chlamydia trachomatis]|nr:Uncharacterised protein [Chlamydia trachomatis]